MDDAGYILTSSIGFTQLSDSIFLVVSDKPVHKIEIWSPYQNYRNDFINIKMTTNFYNVVPPVTKSCIMA